MSLDPQTSIYETVIDDPELAAALEERLKRKTSVANANKRYRQIDETVKARLEELDLGDEAPVRIGRFIVTRKRTAGRSVSFETEPGARLWIKLLPEEGGEGGGEEF